MKLKVLTKVELGNGMKLEIPNEDTEEDDG